MATRAYTPFVASPTEIEELTRDLDEMVHRLGRLTSVAPAQVQATGTKAKAADVREYLRGRRSRGRYLPEALFGEPAWDILLDLFACEIEGRVVSITSACIAAAVPSTTALRWLKKLEECGMIERLDDDSDARRANVRLTREGREGVERWVSVYLGR